jgi:hypothetical protein
LKYTPAEQARIVRAAERLVKARLRLTEATMNGNTPSLEVSGRKFDAAFADHRLITTLARIWGQRPAPAKGKAKR